MDTYRPTAIQKQFATIDGLENAKFAFFLRILCGLGRSAAQKGKNALCFGLFESLHWSRINAQNYVFLSRNKMAAKKHLSPRAQ